MRKGEGERRYERERRDEREERLRKGEGERREDKKGRGFLTFFFFFLSFLDDCLCWNGCWRTF